MYTVYSTQALLQQRQLLYGSTHLSNSNRDFVAGQNSLAEALLHDVIWSRKLYSVYSMRIRMPSVNATCLHVPSFYAASTQVQEKYST